MQRELPIPIVVSHLKMCAAERMLIKERPDDPSWRDRQSILGKRDLDYLGTTTGLDGAAANVTPQSNHCLFTSRSAPASADIILMIVCIMHDPSV